MKKYFYYFMEKGCEIFHKDPMKYKILRYKLSGAQIGDNLRTFSPISAAEPYLIKIGNNVTISTGVKFLTHDNSVIKCVENATDLIGTIQIGNNCFIGANSILLPGVIIGDNSIIGAGSVVTKTIPENVIIGGNPAKIIGTVPVFREKVENRVFNFRNVGYMERKRMILENKEKWIVREELEI